MLGTNLFYKKARIFNSQCSFASTSMTRSPLFDVRRGIPTLVITGNIYNKLGSVHMPRNDMQPLFLQSFF